MDGETSPEAIDALCKTIAICSPSLGALQMTIPYMHNTLQVSDSLRELMPLLPGLTSFSIPIRFMTRKLFTIVSRLPRLEGLLLSLESNIPYAESLLKQIIVKEEAEGESLPFRSLKQIYIYDNPGVETFSLAKALGRGIRLHKLVNLHCSPYCENSDQAVNLMEWVYIACPNVRTINLSGANCVSNLPWQAIQALLQCRDLDTLRIVKSTIDMEFEDIITVAKNRSTWKVLVLPSSEALSYQALVVFAQNCPQLVELGLTLNAASVPRPETDIFLSSLVTLNVGNSAIPSQTGVVMFLSSICRNPLKINSGNQSASWKTVEDLVNFITARVRTLREEITQLQLEWEIHFSQRRQTISSPAPSHRFESTPTQIVEQTVETSSISEDGPLL